MRSVVCITLLAFGAAHAAETPQQGSNFLKLTEGQRYWWIHGAVTTSAHLIAMRDKAKGECVSKWFLSDSEGKQKLVEVTIAKYPDEGPTTIVLSLLAQACGKLTP